ncbi:MAG: PhnD/SsuA/transferrin family substrate-binding protein [Pseudonocardiaceae bacterium]|nr:PhnD/SsuA/transferrin family substrate-binding protein [Pseudonocardiaceae bacterium]
MRRTMRPRKALAVLLAAVTIGALTACGPSQSDANEVEQGAGGVQKVTVGALPISATAALQLGIEKGYFADEGLEITVQSIPNPPAAMAALQGGQVDFAYTPSMPMLTAVSQKIDLKAVAAADGYPENAYQEWVAGGQKTDPADDTAVLVSENSSISSTRDLEGKVVAVPARKTQLEITIASAIRQEGGDPSKVKWIALSFQDMIPALKSGRVDAIGEVTPFIEQARSEDARVISYPGIGTFQEGAVGLWVASSSFIDANPGLVAGFQRAVHKANGYANENLDEAYAKASETTKIPVKTLRAGDPPYWPDTVAVADLKRAAEVMVKLGYLKQAPPLEPLVVQQ